MRSTQTSRSNDQAVFSKRKSSNQTRRSFILVLFLISLLIITFFKIDFIAVKKITVNPPSLSCANEAGIKKITKISGQIFFLVDEETVEKKIKEKFLCIDNVILSKQFPDAIEINLSERKPVALINVYKNGKASLDLKSLEATPSSKAANLNFLQFLPEATKSAKFLIDNTGFVFSTASEENIQTLNIYEDDITLGKIIADDSVKISLQILDRLEPIMSRPNKVTIFNKQIILEGDPTIFFSTKIDIDRQLASLQLILQKAKMRSEDISSVEMKPKVIESIDLRFNKPVVVYSKTNK